VQTNIQKTFRQNSIAAAAASGIIWTAFQSISAKFLVFFAQLILARILVPEDFGVLGLANTIAAFFGVLSDIGVGQTLQQRHPRIHLWTTQAFCTGFFVAAVAGAAMAIYAPIAAQMFRNEKVSDLILVLALDLPLSTLWTLPLVKLQTQMRFTFTATYAIVETAAIQAATILLAWNGFGALSFVLPLPAASAVKAIVFWWFAPVQMRPFRLSKGWSHMFRRTSGLFGASLLAMAASQGDYMILGFLATAQVVGLYYFAFKLSSQPFMALSAAVSGVLRSALIPLREDRTRQTAFALKAAELLVLIAVPVCYLQAAITGPALTLLFGDKWFLAIQLAQILALGLSATPVSLAARALLLARGENSRLFKFQLVSTVFFFILVSAGAFSAEALGVAIGAAIYYTVQPAVFTGLVFFREGVCINTIVMIFFRPAFVSVVTIGSAYLLAQMPSLENKLFMQIFATSVFGISSYILCIVYFSPNAYKDVRRLLVRLFAKHLI